jgi:HEAT repeat protein
LIDAEANKEVLQRALYDTTDFFGVRVDAAEALAKTKDPEVLETLEHYAREETNTYVRQKFEKSAQELRGKMRRPR